MLLALLHGALADLQPRPADREYLARVFGEVKGRPGFIVAEDFALNLD